MARGPPSPASSVGIRPPLVPDWDDEDEGLECSGDAIPTMEEVMQEVLDLRDAPPASTWSPLERQGFGEQDERDALDFDQLIQELLLHQGLLEHRECLDGFRLGCFSPQQASPGRGPGTLGELRRCGTLGELNEEAQATLLAGTLFEYSFSGLDVSVRPATGLLHPHGGTRSPSEVCISPCSDRSFLTPRSPSQCSRGTCGGSSGVSPSRTPGRQSGPSRPRTADEPSSEFSRSGLGQLQSFSASYNSSATQGVNSDLSRSGLGLSASAVQGANSLLLSLDRVLQLSHRGSNHSARTVSSVATSMSPNTARSVGTGGLPMGIRPEAVPELGAESEDEDEGVVSIVAFDSPRSTVSLGASMQRSVSGEGPLGASMDSSHLGFEETMRSELHTARSMVTPLGASGVQQLAYDGFSARTLLGDTLTLEGGLDGGLTDVLHRLAVENLSLDESITRSVRRVLQLGTVLGGQRLSDEEIRDLPKVRFEQAEQQSCAICLEAYQQGEFLNRIRCGHFFHVECLARWMRRATQCPLCREHCTEVGATSSGD